MLEIELKVRVPSLEPARQFLKNHKAQFSGRVHEHDIYYNPPYRDFAVTDEALRVRYTDNHALLTYKGAKRAEYGLKAREELNTALESGAVFEQVLLRLGFLRAAEVNKWRENYRLKDAAISLDTVDELGTFVEIEVMTDPSGPDATERINTLAKEMGISGEPILASYLEMLLSKRSGAQS